MKSRGEIRSIEAYKQLNDFSGLLFERKITPTDFDLVIDFGGSEWVLGEIKHKQASVPYGQRLCLTRALEAHYKAKVKALGIIAYHDYSPSELIPVASLIVAEVWTDPDPGWRLPSRTATILEIIRAWRMSPCFPPFGR